MDYKRIGEFLTRLRKEKDLTQANLADILSVTPQAISRWERGESIPDIRTLKNISDFYNITIDEILEGDTSASNNQNLALQEKSEEAVFHEQLNKSKMINIISFSIALIGLVLFYGITWVFYYEAIGITVQYIYLIISGVITLLAMNKFEYMLEQIDNKELKKKGRIYIKHVLMVGLTFVIISMSLTLPYIIFDSHVFIKSILSFRFYLRIVWVFIIVSIIVSYLINILIERYYYKKYKIKRMLPRTISMNQTVKWITFLYCPAGIIFIFLPLEMEIKLITIVVTGLVSLILVDLYEIFKRKSFILLRELRIILSVLYLYSIFNVSVREHAFLARVPKIEAIIFLFSIVILIYYIVDYVRNKGTYGSMKRLCHKCRLIALATFFVGFHFIAIHSLALHRFRISGTSIIYLEYYYNDFGKEDFFPSFISIAIVLIVDYTCRLIIWNKAQNEKL